MSFLLFISFLSLGVFRNKSNLVSSQNTRTYLSECNCSYFYFLYLSDRCQIHMPCSKVFKHGKLKWPYLFKKKYFEVSFFIAINVFFSACRYVFNMRHFFFIDILTVILNHYFISIYHIHIFSSLILYFFQIYL